jgi:REP element-mobilizing transposase RayT
MPDHVHLFVTLGGRLTLSQCVARLKTKTRVMLELQNAKWQLNFYDHHLRAADSIEAVIRYIHGNPYRAGLIGHKEVWPYFFCRPEDWSWFEKTTDSGQPFPEWL